MKKLFNNYKSSFILLLSIILGAIIGIIIKEKILFLKPFGDLFINLLLVIVPPLIFLTISTSNWNDSTKENKVEITLDESAINQIIFDLPYYETISKCGVIPILEETTGITFKCTTIPNTDITFKILSTILSN